MKQTYTRKEVIDLLSKQRQNCLKDFLASSSDTRDQILNAPSPLSEQETANSKKNTSRIMEILGDDFNEVKLHSDNTQNQAAEKKGLGFGAKVVTVEELLEGIYELLDMISKKEFKPNFKSKLNDGDVYEALTDHNCLVHNWKKGDCKTVKEWGEANVIQSLTESDDFKLVAFGKKPTPIETRLRQDKVKFQINRVFESPYGKVHNGTIKTFKGWKEHFPSLEFADYLVKNDWFKRV